MKYLLLIAGLLLFTMPATAQYLRLPYSADWSDDAPDGWSVLHEGDSCLSTQFNVSIDFNWCLFSPHTVIDDWVVSPELDLSAGAMLKFGWAPYQRYNMTKPGDSLQCWLIDLNAGIRMLLANLQPIGDSMFTHHDTTLHVPVASNNSYIAYRYVNQSDTVFSAVIYQLKVSALPTDVGTLRNGTRQLDVYPNPAEGIISWTTIQQVGNIKQEAYIYDMTGRLMLSAPIADGRMDVSKLAPGLYLLKAGECIAKFLKE